MNPNNAFNLFFKESLSVSIKISLLWKKLQNYCDIKCCICYKEKKSKGERFNYDHLNMFDKNDSICYMVNCGRCIDDIYMEIDLCHILCVPCHHIITEIENKMGFTRIKTNLTKRLNNGMITEEEYKIEREKFQDLYKSKMEMVYEDIRYELNK